MLKGGEFTKVRQLRFLAAQPCSIRFLTSFIGKKIMFYSTHVSETGRFLGLIEICKNFFATHWHGPISIRFSTYTNRKIAIILVAQLNLLLL